MKVNQKRITLFVGITLGLFESAAFAIDHEVSLSWMGSGALISQPSYRRTVGSAVGLQVGYEGFVSPFFGLGVDYGAQFANSGIPIQALTCVTEFAIWGQRPFKETNEKTQFVLLQPIELRLVAGGGFRIFDVSQLDKSEGLQKKSIAKSQGSSNGIVLGFVALSPINNEIRFRFSSLLYLGKVSQVEPSSFAQVGVTFGLARSF